MAVTKPLTLFGLFMMLSHVISLWQNYFLKLKKMSVNFPCVTLGQLSTRTERRESILHLPLNSFSEISMLTYVMIQKMEKKSCT